MDGVHGVGASRPSRSGRVALASSSLCAPTAPHEAQPAVAAPEPAERGERADEWGVLALSEAAFMTTLDSSIVNIGRHPRIARPRPRGREEWRRDLLSDA
jgi:hypothetical protein